MGDFQSQPRSQPRFMEATISVICNKFKVLKNGESPIMVRVAKDGKRSMKSLGVSVNPIYWDFAKNCPKKNCPNRTALMQLISQTLIEYQGKVMEIKVKGVFCPLFAEMQPIFASFVAKLLIISIKSLSLSQDLTTVESCHDSTNRASMFLDEPSGIAERAIAAPRIENNVGFRDG